MKFYKAAFGLLNDYPSVAPNYSAARSQMAKDLGLGASGRRLPAAAEPISKARKAKVPPLSTSLE